MGHTAAGVCVARGPRPSSAGSPGACRSRSSCPRSSATHRIGCRWARRRRRRRRRRCASGGRASVSTTSSAVITSPAETRRARSGRRRGRVPPRGAGEQLHELRCGPQTPRYEPQRMGRRLVRRPSRPPAARPAPSTPRGSPAGALRSGQQASRRTAVRLQLRQLLARPGHRPPEADVPSYAGRGVRRCVRCDDTDGREEFAAGVPAALVLHEVRIDGSIAPDAFQRVVRRHVIGVRPLLRPRLTSPLAARFEVDFAIEADRANDRHRGSRRCQRRPRRLRRARENATRSVL